MTKQEIDRFRKCENCKNKSKQFVGFWDGYDENNNFVGGPAFRCDSTGCDAYDQAMNALIDDVSKSADRRLEVRKYNEQNGVDIQLMADAIRENELLLGDAADMLGISVVLISRYRNEQEPMPKDLYDALMKQLYRDAVHNRRKGFLNGLFGSGLFRKRRDL